jgi:uncharacterized protein YbjT (DUF2867 family)
MHRTILITGATGSVSTALLETLKGSDFRLRALVRDESKGAAPKRNGIEVAVADLDEAETLAPAFEGVDDLWLLTGLGPRAPENSMNALWAARQAGVKRVVRMSAVGASHDAPTRNGRLHALSDDELEHSGMKWTILRPHFFMQNLFASADGIAGQGNIYLNMGEGKLGMIDVRDIAEAAARIFLDDPERHHRKIYTLTGPASLSFAEAAAQLSAALARTISYVPVTHEAARESMLGMGFSKWVAGMMIEYGKAYAAGWGDFTTTHFHDVVGRPSRSFATFARDLAGTFART